MQAGTTTRHSQTGGPSVFSVCKSTPGLALSRIIGSWAASCWPCAFENNGHDDMLQRSCYHLVGPCHSLSSSVSLVSAFCEPLMELERTVEDISLPVRTLTVVQCIILLVHHLIDNQHIMCSDDERLEACQGGYLPVLFAGSASGGSQRAFAGEERL